MQEQRQCSTLAFLKKNHPFMTRLKVLIKLNQEHHIPENEVTGIQSNMTIKRIINQEMITLRGTK